MPKQVEVHDDTFYVPVNWGQYPLNHLLEESVMLLN